MYFFFLSDYRSGTEEDLTELSGLLQEVLDLQREFVCLKKIKQTAQQVGMDAREDSALEALIQEVEEDCSIPLPVTSSSPDPSSSSPSVSSSSPSPVQPVLQSTENFRQQQTHSKKET
uniref:Uncharacterized protein n=1 Tax=Cacopsylla melanoneura TaxID=428564 RepID=A0A8D9BDT1_9HEMI